MLELLRTVYNNVHLPGNTNVGMSSGAIMNPVNPQYYRSIIVTIEFPGHGSIWIKITADNGDLKFSFVPNQNTIEDVDFSIY